MDYKPPKWKLLRVGWKSALKAVQEGSTVKQFGNRYELRDSENCAYGYLTEASYNLFKKALKEHDWIEFNGIPCCKYCGIVRRADGKNKPCKGKLPKITFRKSLQEAVKYAKGQKANVKTEILRVKK